MNQPNSSIEKHQRTTPPPTTKSLKKLKKFLTEPDNFVRCEETMKKIGELIKEMGFSENSSPSTQAAFIKYLIKQGAGVDVEIPDEYLDIKPSKEEELDSKQLSFNFEKSS